MCLLPTCAPVLTTLSLAAMYIIIIIIITIIIIIITKIIVIIYPYLCDPADDTEFSCVVPLLEILLLFISESLLGDDQGPEPLPRHVVHLLVEAVVVLHDGGHHGVRALHIK